MKVKDYKGLKNNKDNKFVLSENKSARIWGQGVIPHSVKNCS